MTEPLLEVRDLSVSYAGLTVVDSISLQLDAGRCLGVIGESGAGKSQAFLAMLGLLGTEARVQGRALLKTEDLIANAARLRGRRVAMIFQDPLTSLTPHLRIGEQIGESCGCTRHGAGRNGNGGGALLDAVRVNDSAPPEAISARASGGMSQRVMIAMATRQRPDV